MRTRGVEERDDHSGSPARVVASSIQQGSHMGDTLVRLGERVGRKVRAIIPLVVGSTVLVLLLSLALTGVQDYPPTDVKQILGRLQAGDLAEARGSCTAA